MSHFTVAVIQDGTKTLDELLLPYMENYCEGLPKEYMEFYEDGECDIDPETGKRGYWQNPNAKWDWWVVGGRWSGFLNTADGPCDEARIGDLILEPSEEEVEKAAAFWEAYVEGKNTEAFPYVFRRPQYYNDRYGTKEKYVKAATGFSTHAVVTPDGEWHEVGEMGWFGLSFETHEEAVSWEEGFVDRFLRDANPDNVITIVDCHI